MPYLGYEFLRVVQRRTRKKEDCLVALFRKADDPESTAGTRRSYKESLSISSLQLDIVNALTSDNSSIDTQADLKELIKGFNALKLELQDNKSYKKIWKSYEDNWLSRSYNNFKNKPRAYKYKDIDFEFEPIPMNE